MCELIMNKNNETNEIEICALENNKIVELYFHNEGCENILGNIYCGVVQNIVDGMGAAFVDIGIEKNTFLPIKDALPKVDVVKEEFLINKLPSEVLTIGDKLLVQVKKEPSKEKGARVSTHITLPGNYIVLMPNTNIITISQKIIENAEIERLKQIIKDILPDGFGAIIRTDAEKIGRELIERDVNEVINKWNEINKMYNNTSNKGLIYNDHDVVIKTVRDMVNQNTKKIYVNDNSIYEKVKIIAEKKCVPVEYVNSDNLFTKYGLISEYENADNRKIWLNCGGYIAIDKTEALTAVDVNSGKYTGDDNLEQTALNVNLEAAREIMKQIRLKDIGGIIVIDYIDLENIDDQCKVIEEMRRASKSDRSKIDIKGYTKLNLVELTRKKLFN